MAISVAMLLGTGSVACIPRDRLIYEGYSLAKLLVIYFELTDHLHALTSSRFELGPSND